MSDLLFELADVLLIFAARAGVELPPRLLDLMLYESPLCDQMQQLVRAVDQLLHAGLSLVLVLVPILNDSFLQRVAIIDDLLHVGVGESTLLVELLVHALDILGRQHALLGRGARDHERSHRGWLVLAVRGAHASCFAVIIVVVVPRVEGPEGSSASLHVSICQFVHGCVEVLLHVLFEIFLREVHERVRVASLLTILLVPSPLLVLGRPRRVGDFVELNSSVLATISEALDSVVFSVFVGVPAPDQAVLVNSCLHVFVVRHILYQETIGHHVAALLAVGSGTMLVALAAVRKDRVLSGLLHRLRLLPEEIEESFLFLGGTLVGISRLVDSAVWIGAINDLTCLST